MRFFLVLIVCLSLGKGIEALGFPHGINVAFFSLVFFMFSPMAAKFLRLKKFQKSCDSWLKSNGYNFTQIGPEPHMLTKGRLKWKVSDAQLVFSIRNSEEIEFWFSCGGWLLGPLTNEIKVFKVRGKELTVVDTLKA